MRYIYLIVIFIYFPITLSAQTIAWKKLNSDKVSTLQSEVLAAKKLKTFALYTLESDFRLSDIVQRTSSIILQIPDPQGKWDTFTLKERALFHPDLAKKYPQFKSYYGKTSSPPYKTIDMSYSNGEWAMMVSGDPNGLYYIDAIKDKNKTYVCYYKKNILKPFTPYSCGVSTDVGIDLNPSNLDNNATSTGDCALRQYRLALACTGEYAQYHGGTVEGVLAAYNKSMTRVNGVYERESGITMQLIPNTDQLIFFDASSDPYTNSSGSAMLQQNQNTIDNIIGLQNYDIGHVYSTGGGGIASLRSPCTSRRAQGVTGQPRPEGDPFDIDYVAHEMGHQFGANHTQNNDCNRNDNTAVEPGSASTIMGYAGICEPNVVNNSHDNFHAISLQEIASFITGPVGNGCAEILDNPNTPPILNIPQSDFTIPRSTSFSLTAIASDDTPENMTYTWEQMDNEVAPMPPVSTSTVGPMFRAIPPTPSPTRHFPDLFNRYAGWEILPAANRTLQFRCTVRDNNPALGCTDEADVSVHVRSSAGPFRVTYPNLPNLIWPIGSEQTITWTVNNTDGPEINCQNVDIFLSVDGGNSYTISLAEQVPNVGSYTLQTPNLPSTKARIMVKSANNIFYDVSNANFTILSNFILNTDTTYYSICDTTTFSFNLKIDKITNSTDEVQVNFESSNGVVASFGSNSIPFGDSTSVTLSNLSSLIPGENEITITGSTDNEMQVIQIILFYAPDEPKDIELIFPPNNAKADFNNEVTLIWGKKHSAATYQITVSENINFESSALTFTTQDTFINIYAAYDVVYYWKVLPINDCFEYNSSELYNFQSTLYPTKSPYYTNKKPVLVNKGQTEKLDTSHLQLFYNNQDAITLYITRLPLHGEILNFNGDTLTPFDTLELNQPFLTYAHDGSDTSTDSIGISYVDDTGRWAISINIPVIIIDTMTVFYVEKMKDILCANSSDGHIVVRTFPEQASETIKSYGINKSSYQDSPHFEQLSPGKYTVDIILLNNSIWTIDTVEIRELPPLEIDIIQDFYSFEFIANGGSEFNSLTIDDAPVSLSEPIKDLDNNTYLVTLTDKLGCTLDSVWTVNILPLSIKIDTIIDIDCPAELATIKAEVSGGFPPYIYSTTGLQYNNSNIFMLPADTYIIYAKDQGGKIIQSDSVYLDAVKPFEVSVTSQKNVVYVTIQGGTSPYELSTDNINYETTDSLVFPGIGNYTIFIRDAKGCTFSRSITLNYLRDVRVTKRDISCHGLQDGYVRLLAVNGAFPFTYSFDNGDFSTIREFSNLRPGSYPFIVKDNNNDTLQGIIDILEPEPLKLNIMISNDTLSLDAEGGISPYLFTIDGGEVFLDIKEFANLPSNTYIVGVRDDNNCITLDTVNITSSFDLSIMQNLSIAPNPFQDFLTITMQNEYLKTLENEYLIHIYNGIGQNVSSIIWPNIDVSPHFKITTQNWDKGIFFIVITSKDGLIIHSEKIIKTY